MTNSIDRRQFLVGTTTVAAGAALGGCAEPGSDFVHPPGVELGPFGSKSTAEEVTEGLDLTGKTALITGANSGLGFETMRVLAARGAKVIGTGRTPEKAEKACASIENGRATPAVLELSNLESVASCTNQVRDMDTPIDMLILNAGIMALPDLEQVDGIERQFFVNHLGHFALTLGLLDRVKAAPAGRIVVLSSSGHQWAPDGGIQFDNLSGERDYDPMKMYGQSKLANGLFAFELARRLEGTNATANAVHPGIINTNLGRHFPKWQLVVSKAFGWIFMKTVPEGAATQTYVAASPLVEGMTGFYFADCNPVVPDPRMEDAALAAQLWDESEVLTGVRPA